MELIAFQQADGTWRLKTDGALEEPEEAFTSQAALVEWVNQHPETGSATLQFELWAGEPAPAPQADAVIEAEPAGAGAGEAPPVKKAAARRSKKAT